MFTYKVSALRVAAFVMLSGCVSAAVEHYGRRRTSDLSFDLWFDRSSNPAP